LSEKTSSVAKKSFFLFLLTCGRLSYASEPDLFKDLALVEKINQEIHDELPFFYNYSMVGGYFVMPSARMPKTGMAAFGGGYVSPYQIYGANFQVYDHVELSANYRIYSGISEGNFGKEGFGDDAERIANAKIALLLPEDGYPALPSIAVGAEDFIGTKRFTSKYIVVTKQWLGANLEGTLGWSKGHIKGWFGGASWTPFRQHPHHFLKTVSLRAEYDATNYKHHFHEHPYGRTVKSRINAGVSCTAWDTLQLSVSSLRGEKVAASASLRYPLGTSKGLFPKIDDPIPYYSPVDTQPLGAFRPEGEFAHELAYAFSDQGLDLYTVFLIYDSEKRKNLWMKVVNNRYREEEVVRDRIKHVLAALVPSDVILVDVVVEADGILSHGYRFRREDLDRYRLGIIGGFEIETLAPIREAIFPPSEYDSILLFERKKNIWTFTIRPRLLTFFGSAQGKFKYNLGMVASPDGYLFDQVYYKFSLSYQIKSSMSNLGPTDRINPSQLPQVRTDTIKYFQTNSVSIEQAYVQRAWNLGKGFFYRLATGYFEPAYGGIATELLYYPVNSDWAIGVEAATVLKRKYHGIGFTNKIRRLKGTTLHHEHFIGIQYFLDFYYDFKPLELDLKITAGQFLAKDLGVKTEVGRTFSNGVRFSLWYTWTNGHDKVNGKTYYDKGFSFLIPLDFFLKQSSLNYIGYAMSAWLRDVGAIAETGRKLYFSLWEERH
jgi:hypothetical protein